MKIEIPDKIVEEIMESNFITSRWDIQTAEARAEYSRRLQSHYSEIIGAIVLKMIISHGMLPTQSNY